MSVVAKERLLAEVEDIIRQMPPREAIRQDSAWFGRAFAAIDNWDPYKSPLARQYHSQFLSNSGSWAEPHLQEFLALLHQARHDLLMQVPSAGTVAVPHGMVFDYFDELRKIIELGKQDVLFQDFPQNLTVGLAKPRRINGLTGFRSGRGRNPW